MASLSIRNLRKSFNDVDIINGVNLEVKDREFVVFVGPSGCGKSTLLRLIAGLEDVTSGHIFLGDNDITDLKPAKRDLAMVFQSYALYPHMTVRKNMSFALKLAGMPKDEMNAKVDEAARVLELEPLLERKPKALSGGQRQRVAIGRAIVRNPQVFLFDEPLSNLDAALRVQMRLELAKLHQDLDATMIYVTHDQVEAMTLADKVVVLNKGNVEQVGSPLDLYHNPANLFVAGFMGTPKMSLFPARIEQRDDNIIQVELEAGVRLSFTGVAGNLKPGETVTVGIRPEHMQVVDKAKANLHGTLEVSEHLGSDTYCHLELSNGQAITVRASGDFEGDHGDPIHLAVDTGRCHLFDAQGLSAR